MKTQNQLRIAAIPALLALAGSLWLWWLRQQGTQDSGGIGCGGGGGCDLALQGKWATWLGLPVSLLAAAVYLASASLLLSPLRTRCGPLISLLAGAAVGGALWFTGLMLSEKSACLWCLSVHVLGLVFAGLVWLGSDSKARWPAVIGVCGSVATLACGQLLKPASAGPKITTIHDPITMAEHGGVAFRLGEAPCEQRSTAKHVLVEFFDYTCKSCQELAADLEILRARHGEKFSIIYLPCPLNRQCNTHLRSEVTDHPLACEYAKLSLAIWRAKPADWPAFHKTLYQAAARSDYAAAESSASQLLGSREALTTAMKDPSLLAQLASITAHYDKLATESIVMPKMIIKPNRVLHGIGLSQADYFSTLEKELGW